MNKVYREAVDVDLAFLIASKHIKSANAQVKDPAKGNKNNAGTNSNSTEKPHLDEKNKLSSRKIIKKALRSFARNVYRLARPFVRPIIFRTRAYFTEELRQDIIRELHKSSAANARELQSTLETLRREMVKSFAASKQEIQKASATSVQEAQATREMLRRGVIERLNRIEQLDRIEQYSYAAARRITVNCGSGDILVRTEVGFVICSATDHALIATLIESGELESGTRLLIQRFLRPGDTYIDVGANIGMHVLAAARAMQGQGKIIAFEPFEPTRRMLEKTVWMNGFSDMIEIHQAAAFNAAGTKRLYLGATSGHHSLYEVGSSDQSSNASVEVPLVRLDGVIPSGQRIDLLKIDAEGAELEVIEGGVSFIRDNEDIALILEFGPSHLSRTNHTLDQWFKAFDELGLTYQAINPYSGAFEAWPREQLEQVDSVNLFLARANSKAWGRLGT